MNKIVVTGYKGFIGRNLYTRLVEQNYSVVGLSSDYLDYDNWKEKLIQFLDTNNPKTIFHVGACSNTLVKDVNYAFVRNYESTKVISDWSAKHKTSLIYSSSAACYGTNSINPSNLYGWTKLCAEDYILKSGGISLRYFNVFGPGEYQKGNMASFIFQVIEKNRSQLPIKLFPGSPRRDFVYIEDVLSANVFSSLNYRSINKEQYYEVGTGKANTFERILKILDFSYEYEDKNTIPPGYQFYTKSNSDRWLPDWKPKYSLEQAISIYKSYNERIDRLG